MDETLLNQNRFKADSLVIMTLNKQLKTLLKEKDITIAQLARATKISAKTLYQWLNGQSPKNLVQVRKVADYFAVTIDYLAFGIIQKNNLELIDFKNEFNAGVFEVILRKQKITGGK